VNNISPIFLWVFGLAVIVLMWLASLVSVILIISRTEHSLEQLSHIGDTFGAIHALFTGLAFVAVFITLYFQSKALKLTREEIDIRSFETQYFNFLKVHNDIIQGIGKYKTVGGVHIKIEGRERMKELYASMVRYYNNVYEQNPYEKPSEIINKSFKLFYNENHHEIGHYLRHLYNIVKFVDNSTYPFHHKIIYLNLLRAQLSSYELLLLFYNCLSDDGNRRLKPLVEKYSILEAIPFDDLISKKLDLEHEHESLYDEKAYGEKR